MQFARLIILLGRIILGWFFIPIMAISFVILFKEVAKITIRGFIHPLKMKYRG